MYALNDFLVPPSWLHITSDNIIIYDGHMRMIRSPPPLRHVSIWSASLAVWSFESLTLIRLLLGINTNCVSFGLPQYLSQSLLYMLWISCLVMFICKFVAYNLHATQITRRFGHLYGQVQRPHLMVGWNVSIVVMILIFSLIKCLKKKMPQNSGILFMRNY